MQIEFESINWGRKNDSKKVSPSQVMILLMASSSSQFDAWEEDPVRSYLIYLPNERPADWTDDSITWIPLTTLKDKTQWHRRKSIGFPMEPAEAGEANVQ